MKQIDALGAVDPEIDQLLRQAVNLLPEPVSPDFSGLAIETAAFSPDGKSLTGVSQKRIIVSWDCNSWESREWNVRLTVPKFTGSGGFLWGLASATTASLWDLQSNEGKNIPLKQDETTKAVSPDGKYFVTIVQSKAELPPNTDILQRRLGVRRGLMKAYKGRSDTTAWVLSTDLNGTRVPLPHGAIVTLVVFSQDGSKIATAGSLGVVKVWEAQEGKLTNMLWTVAPFEPTWPKLSSLTFSSTAEYLAATSDKGLWLWSLTDTDTSGGKQVRLPSRPVSEGPVALSTDGKLVATGEANGTARIWDLKSRKERVRLFHNGGLKKVVFKPDGKGLATATQDGIIRFWDVDTGTEINRVMDSGQLVGFNPDGTYLATTNRVWKVGSASDRRRISQGEAVFGMSLSHDGAHLATTTGSYDIRVWNVIEGKEILHLGRSMMGALSFSPDGEKLALGPHIIRWRDDPLEKADVLVDNGYVTAVAFTPDGGHLALGDEGKRVNIWRLADKKKIVSLDHQSRIWSLEFSPDGSKLASSDGLTIRVWRWQDDTDNLVARLETTGTQKFFGIAWSPDGERLAVAGGPVSGRVWDPFADKILFATPLRFGISHDIAYSPDGGFIATGSMDGYLRVWEIETGTLASEILGHVEAVRRVDFDPEGGHLFSASLDGTVGHWPWRPKELIAYSCSQLTRKHLSQREENQFLGSQEHKGTCGPHMGNTLQSSNIDTVQEGATAENFAITNTMVPVAPAERTETQGNFLMPVEDVFFLKGKIVVTGTIERGQLTVGDELEVVGCPDGICPGPGGNAPGQRPRAIGIVAAIEQRRKTVHTAVAGDSIGIFLQGIKKGRVKRGQVLATPGSINAHTRFKADVYILTTNEGGRHTPLFTGYRPQFYFRTTDVTGMVELPPGKMMVMLGDHASIAVELVVPIALEKGLTFFIREAGRTIGRGTVSEIPS
jgi:elongation factor Tu